MVTEKCGASGMCVQTLEPLEISRDGSGISVSGLPGLTDPAALRLSGDGAFELRPPKAAFDAPGTAFDHMAVRFAGRCDKAGDDG